LKAPNSVAYMLPPAVAQAAPWKRRELSGMGLCLRELSAVEIQSSSWCRMLTTYARVAIRTRGKRQMWMFGKRPHLLIEESLEVIEGRHVLNIKCGET